MRLFYNKIPSFFLLWAGLMLLGLLQWVAPLDAGSTLPLLVLAAATVFFYFLSGAYKRPTMLKMLLRQVLARGTALLKRLLGFMFKQNPLTNVKCSVRLNLTPMFLLFGVLLFGAFEANAQSGTVFRDFNGNGLKNGAEPGVQGVNVRLYANAVAPNTDQLIGETVTGASGTYDFAVSVTSGRAANVGEDVRVEFDIPTSFECDLDELVDFPGGGGSVYGTSVQFITGRPSGINFAINYPGQWAPNPNPLVMLPCYAFGDPALTGSTATDAPSFISYNFLTNGVPFPNSGADGTPPVNGGNAGVPLPNKLSTIGEVGSLYGVAFSKQAQKVFTSAVLRRHSNKRSKNRRSRLLSDFIKSLLSAS